MTCIKVEKLTDLETTKLLLSAHSEIAHAELNNALGYHESAKSSVIAAIEISAAHHEIYKTHADKILDLATNFDLLGKICELEIDLDYC